MKKQLTKSRRNVVLSGVLGGIGEYFGIDPTWIRIVFVILLVMGWGSPALIYIILAVIIPSAPRESQQNYYGSYNSTKGKPRQRKEAEKIDEDDWSDF